MGPAEPEGAWQLWAWWSPSEDAPVPKVPFEEREMLIEVAPEQFFFTLHYRSHPMILVRPEQFDPDWARSNLIRGVSQPPPGWLDWRKSQKGVLTLCQILN